MWGHPLSTASQRRRAPGANLFPVLEILASGASRGMALDIRHKEESATAEALPATGNSLSYFFVDLELHRTRFGLSHHLHYPNSTSQTGGFLDRGQVQIKSHTGGFLHVGGFLDCLQFPCTTHTFFSIRVG